VLRYASDFIPSWAGAISIDLMPAVLVLILCVVQAGIRREGAPQIDANSMSAAELMTALRLAREVDELQGTTRVRVQVAEPEAKPAPEAAARHDDAPPRPYLDENVTTLATARAG
jgi:hypothetical protein